MRRSPPRASSASRAYKARPRDGRSGTASRSARPRPPPAAGRGRRVDRRSASREELRGEVAEGGHELGLDQLELLGAGGSRMPRSRPAGSRLPGGRHLRTLAMYTSRRVRRCPREDGRGACPRSHEQVALLVLVEARRLAHEHQVGVRVADAVDDLRAALRKAAARACRPRCPAACASRASRRLSASGSAATAPAAAAPPDAGPPKLGCSAVPP